MYKPRGKLNRLPAKTVVEGLLPSILGLAHAASALSTQYQRSAQQHLAMCAMMQSSSGARRVNHVVCMLSFSSPLRSRIAAPVTCPVRNRVNEVSPQVRVVRAAAEVGGSHSPGQLKVARDPGVAAGAVDRVHILSNEIVPLPQRTQSQLPLQTIPSCTLFKHCRKPQHQRVGRRILTNMPPLLDSAHCAPNMSSIVFEACANTISSPRPQGLP
eukprot:3460908-Rhodomonas_salina.1